MEGESAHLKDGALSLQASLSHRELPPRPRHLESGNLFRFSGVAGTWGKFLFRAGGNFFESTASRTVGGWEAGNKGAGGNSRFPPAVLFISFRYRI